MTEEWKIQVSKKINGDLWNIRASSAEEFLELTRALAEHGEAALEFLGDFVQATIAKMVQTDGYSAAPRSGGNSTSATATRGGVPTCKHGEMKDLGDRGYRHRYYCPSKSRSDRCDARD
jgi:hypothetical protein